MRILSVAISCSQGKIMLHLDDGKKKIIFAVKSDGLFANRNWGVDRQLIILIY